MNILLPLYPADPARRALLSEMLRHTPFLRDLAALGGPPPDWRVLAVSADRNLLDMAAASGVECRELDLKPEPDRCGFLPGGAYAALESMLSEDSRDGADAFWCVLDLSVPLPGAPTLDGVEKAVRLYERETPLAVASVVEVDDHPSQLDAYFRLIDVELLALLYPEEKGRWLQTEPLIVHWEAFGAESPPPEGRPYVLEPEADSWRLRPETTAYGTSENPDSIRLLSAARGRARRIVPEAALRVDSGSTACAVPFFKPPNAASCLLLRESGTELGLYIREDAGQGVPFVRVWPIGGRRLLPVPPLENHGRTPDAGQRRIVYGKTAYAGPVLRFTPPDGTDALAVAVLERSSGADVDFMEPLEAPSAPEPFWLVDKGTKQRTNGRTGRPITGRQDFNPLYEFDRALCLFRAKDFFDLAQASAQGRVAGLVLAESGEAGRV